jgi:hypothetical protein
VAAESAVIAGHFGFAAAVKAKERTTPLWALMLATQWLDVVFAPLLGAGVETMQPLDATRPTAYGDAIIHADYTHSLVGALALSIVIGLALGAKYGKRSGVVIGLVAMSHWLLDLPMHRGDMPILPGGAETLGFGLWRSPIASAIVELALVLAGAWLYGRAARDVAGDDSAMQRRARLCTILIAGGGVGVLALNLVGV